MFSDGSFVESFHLLFFSFLFSVCIGIGRGLSVVGNRRDQTILNLVSFLWLASIK